VDIHDILTTIASQVKFNLVIPPKISGKITIFLDNVTIANAIKIITNSAGYSYYIKDNIIFVDSKENIEKITGKEGVETKVFNVNYAKTGDIENNIKELLSKEGKVIIDSRTNSIMVTDFKANIAKVSKFIKTLDKPTKQVMIEAKIVVVTNDASKELGIQWGGSLVDRLSSDKFFYGIKGSSNIGTATGTTNTENTATTTTTSDINNEFPGAGSITTAVPPGIQSSVNLTDISIPSGYVVNLPTVSSPAGGIGLIFGKWGYYNLSIKLTALKSKDLVKVISSPKVLALDNEKASIGQGVEIPYKTVSDSGTDTQFKDAKLKLEVTPHIASNNIITLEIHLSKDSVGKFTVNGEPAINTQEITTKLQLRNGETAMIGGIVEKNDTKSETKVPFFGDIPIFGGLFKNSINKNSHGELIIFITPKIVE